MCRIYHLAVCQQKPSDCCTDCISLCCLLSFRPACTLPGNLFRCVKDPPQSDAMSQLKSMCECVCMSVLFYLSVCLCVINGLHMTYKKKKKHPQVCLWQLFCCEKHFSHNSLYVCVSVPTTTCCKYIYRFILYCDKVL